MDMTLFCVRQDVAPADLNTQITGQEKRLGVTNEMAASHSTQATAV